MKIISTFEVQSDMTIGVCANSLVLQSCLFVLSATVLIVSG